jgi:sarcosine oxidase
MSRIVIIGAGIVGLSVARAALKRGHQVIVLEQGAAPNPQSASFDNHRMIRYPYGSAAGYTRMVTEAFGSLGPALVGSWHGAFREHGRDRDLA